MSIEINTIHIAKAQICPPQIVSKPTHTYVGIHCTSYTKAFKSKPNLMRWQPPLGNT